MVEDIDSPDWSQAATMPLDHAGKLKVIRARLGMSQSLFADLIGVPPSSLRNWEQRRTMPEAPARTLIDLIYEDPFGLRERLLRTRAA